MNHAQGSTLSSAYPSCFFPVPSHHFLKTGPDPQSQTAGFCALCNVTHRLDSGPAYRYALELVERLQQAKRIDFLAENKGADPHFSTDYLFGKARGQMFGVMLCRHQDGTLGTLHAFSCQYNGRWEVGGWVPPLFDVYNMQALVVDVEQEIKALGRKLERLLDDMVTLERVRCRRRDLSRQLMLDIHGEYRLTNFHGTTKKLREVFDSSKGIPTGAGDCCAPKLLNYAARHSLIPLGIAEFYWGMDNRSASRVHGEFYSACLDKCAPILGFLLCGLS